MNDVISESTNGLEEEEDDDVVDKKRIQQDIIE